LAGVLPLYIVYSILSFSHKSLLQILSRNRASFLQIYRDYRE
jgi:hypothetical protein